jgi:hypothetical protein
MGLHIGFITHGRYSHDVYRASSVFVSPRFVYMMVDRVITAIYGNASAKYSEGTHPIGFDLRVLE